MYMHKRRKSAEQKWLLHGCKVHHDSKLLTSKESLLKYDICMHVYVYLSH